MYTLNGDISYSTDDGYLVLHTQSGDIMIPTEDLEELALVIGELLNDTE